MLIFLDRSIEEELADLKREKRIRELETRSLPLDALKKIFGNTDSDEYIVKIASTLEEFTKLREVGFTYICDYGDKIVLKKRK